MTPKHVKNDDLDYSHQNENDSSALDMIEHTKDLNFPTIDLQLF